MRRSPYWPSQTVLRTVQRGDHDSVDDGDEDAVRHSRRQRRSRNGYSPRPPLVQGDLDAASSKSTLSRT